MVLRGTIARPSSRSIEAVAARRCGRQGWRAVCLACLGLALALAAVGEAPAAASLLPIEGMDPGESAPHGVIAADAPMSNVTAAVSGRADAAVTEAGGGAAVRPFAMAEPPRLFDIGRAMAGACAIIGREHCGSDSVPAASVPEAAQVSAVPLPSALILALTGLVAVGALARRRPV